MLDSEEVGVTVIFKEGSDADVRAEIPLLEAARYIIEGLPREQRLEVFSYFCVHCGKRCDDICHCMNDE